MNNDKQWIRIALLGLLLVRPLSAAEASFRPGGQDRSTSEVSVQLSTRSASAPLDMRVSVRYVNSKAADMLKVLAKAAGLTVEMPAAPLQPVTLTLTNVRLRTALDAICDTAACTWRLEGTTIKVVAAGGNESMSALPATVSIALDEVPVRDFFHAIGAAINVPVTIEGSPDRPPLTAKFTNAPTTTVLDFLCKKAGCTWDFDGTALHVWFKAP
jgi:hypothetical protein